MSEKLSREDLARLVAQDIQPGSFVNLGIGQPTSVSNYLTAEQDITLHTENGMLGMGPEAHGDEIDQDLINAGKVPVTEVPGASYFHHADSFAMMRGGHLDVCVLGAFQVSATGDLANWHTGAPDAIPAVGGAMDLATGAKDVYVMMSLFAKDGTPKLVPECSYPLTGVGCVTRVYTNDAVFLLTPEGVRVRETFGTTLEELQSKMDIKLLPPLPSKAPVKLEGTMTETKTPGDQFVQSLARGLTVIRAFDADNVTMTLSEVSKRTGLTRATARRFLHTLVDLGYVRTDGRVFELTALVLQLGYSYLAGQSLPQLVQPLLEELSAELHESTSASILDGDEIVYIARIHTRRIMTVGIMVGTRFPAYATSMGRVLLAGLPTEELEERLASTTLKQLTPRTIADPVQLRAELDTVRSQGWSLVDQELEIGLRSVAVPVLHPDGSVAAALNMSMQASLADGTRDVDAVVAEALPKLRAASAKITDALRAQQ